MSITAGAPQRNCKKSSHRRHDSDELGVFEAARYFSGANEVSGANYTHQKILRSGGRISLDIPMSSTTRNSYIQAQTQQCNHAILEKTTTKEKKYKQPNSPGGRLASFLNSLFSQNSSKKKKSKSCPAQSVKDEDHECPGGRRKRRSSISYFLSVNTTTNISSSLDNSKSSVRFSSSTPEFITPPYSNTPSNDLKKFVDHHKQRVRNVPTLSNNNRRVKSSGSQNHDIKRMSTDRDHAWLDDDKFKFSTTTSNNNGFLSEKCKMFGNSFIDQSSRRDFRNFINEMDDGADSDSSSDLFELQNYDLGCCYSSGLPVYETTHINNIKRGAPIKSCAI